MYKTKCKQAGDKPEILKQHKHSYIKSKYHIYLYKCSLPIKRLAPPLLQVLRDFIDF